MSKRTPRRLASWLSVAGVLAIACSAPVHAQPTTWYVDNTATAPYYGTAEHPFLTIEDGIDAASDGDTVLVLDGTGTYTGAGNRDLSISDLAITLESANGPENCIIDCDGTSSNHHRAFTITTTTGEVTRIEGFTIREGYVYTVNDDDGGAILNMDDDVEEPDGELEIVNCVFESNYADHDGGAVYNSGDGEFGDN